jgi:hypothetical protein
MNNHESFNKSVDNFSWQDEAIRLRLELFKKENNMDNLNELASALALAQGEMRCAEKDSSNPHFKSSYASLDSVIDAIREPLSKNGLSIVQITDYVDGNEFLITRLMHKSGQFIESKMFLNPTIKPQERGSLLTYYRRYQLSAMCSITQGADKDDDGNLASQQAAKPAAKPVVKPAPAAVALISEEDVAELEDLIGDNVELLNDALLKGKIDSLKQLEKNRLSGFISWIEKEKSKRAEAEDFIL